MVGQSLIANLLLLFHIIPLIGDLSNLSDLSFDLSILRKKVIFTFLLNTTVKYSSMLIQSKSIFKQQGLINLKICTIMYYLHSYNKFLSIQKNSDANSTANKDKCIY